MGMPFNLKRSALLCSLALAVPGFVIAADTLVVTAQPAETADSPTSGYTAKTSAARQNRSTVDYHRPVRFGGDAAADRRSGRDGC